MYGHKEGCKEYYEGCDVHIKKGVRSIMKGVMCIKKGGRSIMKGVMCIKKGVRSIMKCVGERKAR